MMENLSITSVNVVHTVEAGLPLEMIPQIAEKMGFSSKEVVELMPVSTKTWNRMKKEGRPLNPTLSSFAVFLYRLAEAGSHTFDSPDIFRQWLYSPLRSLGNKKPVEFLITIVGIELVTDLIGRIREGVFS